MHKFNLGLMLIVGSLFWGCVSFPDASEKNQTLTIGQVILEAKGWSTANISINGTHKVGIEITIQNSENEKAYLVKSRSDGLFYTTNIPKGNYKITKMYFKKTSGSAWRDVWIEPSRGQFEIQDGCVNNFGILAWHAESSKSTLTGNNEYEEVRMLFLEKYVSSNWNEKEWKSTAIGR